MLVKPRRRLTVAPYGPTTGPSRSYAASAWSAHARATLRAGRPTGQVRRSNIPETAKYSEEATVGMDARPLELARLRCIVAWRQAVRVQAEIKRLCQEESQGNDPVTMPQGSRAPSRPTQSCADRSYAEDHSCHSHQRLRGQPPSHPAAAVPAAAAAGLSHAEAEAVRLGCHDHRRRRGVCGLGSRGGARQQGHDDNTSSYSFGDSDGAEWRTKRGAN